MDSSFYSGSFCQLPDGGLSAPPSTAMYCAANASLEKDGASFCYASKIPCSSTEDCNKNGMQDATCSSKGFCLCGSNIDCSSIAPGSFCSSKGVCTCMPGTHLPSGTLYRKNSGCSEPIPCDDTWAPSGPCGDGQTGPMNFTTCLAGLCKETSCIGEYTGVCNECTKFSQSSAEEAKACDAEVGRAGSSMGCPYNLDSTFSSASCPQTPCASGQICHNGTCITASSCKTNEDCACSLYCTSGNYCAPAPPCECSALYSKNTCASSCTTCDANDSCAFVDGKWQWTSDVSCSPNALCAPVKGKKNPAWICKNGVPSCTNRTIECNPPSRTGSQALVNPCSGAVAPTCPDGQTCVISGDRSYCKNFGGSGCMGSLCGKLPDGTICSQHSWGDSVDPGECPTGYECTSKPGYYKKPYYCALPPGTQFVTKDFLDAFLPNFNRCPTYLNLGQGTTNQCYENRLKYDTTTIDGKTTQKAGQPFITSIAASDPLAFYMPAIGGGDPTSGVVPANYGNIPNQTNLQILMSFDPNAANYASPTMCGATDAIESPCIPLGGGLPCTSGTKAVTVPNPDTWYQVPAEVMTSLKKKFSKVDIPPYFAVFACKHSEFCPQGFQRDVLGMFGSEKGKGPQPADPPIYTYGCKRIPLPIAGEMCRYSSDHMSCSHENCSAQFPQNLYDTECHHDSSGSYGGTGLTMCGEFTATDKWVGPVPGGYFYVPNGTDQDIYYEHCKSASCNNFQKSFRADDDTTRYGVSILDWTPGHW